MPRKNAEREARRERRKELLAILESAGISDVAGIQELYKEMFIISTVVQVRKKLPFYFSIST